MYTTPAMWRPASAFAACRRPAFAYKRCRFGLAGASRTLVGALVESADTDELTIISNYSGECTAVCPKGIPLSTIARLNSDYLHAVRAAS